ncbi:MAG TPA: methyltransferase domain-containing protein [Planctomycetota bacterium]|nr:methyltransferase domain-containing protein [Planctomycetota bacterium]
MPFLDAVRRRVARFAQRWWELDPAIDAEAAADRIALHCPEVLQHHACGVCGARDLRYVCSGRRLLGRRLYAGAPRLPRSARRLPSNYRECKQCGAARISPAPRREWIDFDPGPANPNTAHWMEEPDYVEDKQRSVAVHHERLGLTRFQSERCSVLDVSCGSGVGLATMRDRFAWRDCRGVECDPVAAGAARAWRGLDVQQGLVYDSVLPDAHHDLVMFDNSLEHHAEPRLALRRARRTLRPGGAVAIVVPNWHGLAVEILASQYWNLNWGHWHYFTVQSLAGVLHSESLQLVRAYCDGVEEAVAARLEHCLPPGVVVDLDGTAIAALPRTERVFRGDYITLLAVAV